MANKIDNLVDGLVGKLEELVADGTLKAVHQRLIHPVNEAKAPVAGVVLSSGRRKGDVEWEIFALLMVATRSKETTATEAITELLALIDAKIRAFNDSDAPGGVIDMPDWDIWYHPSSPVAPVGAWASIRMQLSGPLTA